MKNDLTCEVVQDLLPSYVDGLTSEVSNQAVEQHMKICESCRELYHEMKEPLTTDASSEMKQCQQESERASEIDYLKKIRKKNRMRILAAGLSVVVVFGAGLWCKIFLIGQKVKQAELVQINEVTVVNDKVSLQGTLLDTTKGVSDVEFQEQDGVVMISLRETGKSFFHANDFQTDYQSDEEVKQVVLENRILWDNGTAIDGVVSNLYQSKNLYIGDNSADGRAVQAVRKALGIREDVLQGDGMQLQTTQEPYGMTFFQVQISANDDVDRLQQEMKNMGCLLIAVTDNLGYVSFEYHVDGAEDAVMTITEADADAMAGQSVKTMAQTPAGLQELVELLK